MFTGFTNGFFAALTKIKTGGPSGGGVTGYDYELKQVYTGVEAVDKVLVTLVAFFAAWLDAGNPLEGSGSGDQGGSSSSRWEGPWLEGFQQQHMVKGGVEVERGGGRTWDVDVPLWMAMVQFAGAWGLVSVEGGRKGNKRGLARVAGW